MQKCEIMLDYLSAQNFIPDFKYRFIKQMAIFSVQIIEIIPNDMHYIICLLYALNIGHIISYNLYGPYDLIHIKWPIRYAANEFTLKSNEVLLVQTHVHNPLIQS